MSLRRALACWAAAALLLAGCGGSDEPRKAPAQQTLTVATGSQGGIYSVWGAAYARAITKQLEGYRGVATRTTGSVENLERLRDGRAQIALTLGDTALDAVEGREAFDRPVALKALAQIYPSYVQLVTRAGSGIGTLADLEGKRVSVGSPDSGTQVVADRVLDVAKVGGFKRVQLGIERVGAMRSSRGSSTRSSGPAACPPPRSRSSRSAPRSASSTSAATRARCASAGAASTSGGSLPAGAYGLSERVSTITIPNYVVVGDRMDAALAHDLTSLLFSSGRVTDRERAQDVIAEIGLHPGAQAYFSGG